MRGWSHKPAGGSWAGAELAVGSKCDCGGGAARGLDDHCDDCRPKLFRLARGRAAGDTQRERGPATGGLIAEDDAGTLTAGQMRKSEFLRQLRGEACAAADAAMADVGRSTAGCPYVDRMLSLYAGRPAREVERAMRLYAPEARGAASAADYLLPVTARVARGAAHWARTGSLPEDAPAELRSGAIGGASGLRGVLGAGAGLISGVASAMARRLGKGKGEGGAARAGADRGAPAKRPGEPRPLDATRKRRWTPELALQAMEEYGALGDADRELWIETWAPLGEIGNLLRALDRSTGVVDRRLAADLRDLLGRLQKWRSSEPARASELDDEAALARVQADFKAARGVAEAEENPANSAPRPTPGSAAVEQHGEIAARTSIAPPTRTMTSDEEDTIKAELAGAIPRFVAWCTRTHPELGITEDMLLADPRRVFNARAHAIAVSDGAGHAVVGKDFARQVNTSPASALPAVVREMFGHSEPGSSSPSDSYARELYHQAAARMPGYARPIGASGRSELDAYGTQETETSAEKREVEPGPSSDPRAVDADKEVIDERIPSIIAQWDPRIAKALLRGFYLRLRTDPRVTAHALDSFRSGIRLHVTTSRGFAPGDARDILS